MLLQNWTTILFWTKLLLSLSIMIFWFFVQLPSVFNIIITNFFVIKFTIKTVKTLSFKRTNKTTFTQTPFMKSCLLFKVSYQVISLRISNNILKLDNLCTAKHWLANNNLTCSEQPAKANTTAIVCLRTVGDGCCSFHCAPHPFTCPSVYCSGSKSGQHISLFTNHLLSWVTVRRFFAD